MFMLHYGINTTMYCNSCIIQNCLECELFHAMAADANEEKMKPLRQEYEHNKLEGNDVDLDKLSE